MKHLTPEILARLVDEVPDAGERDHLTRCSRCRTELEALQEQTEALSHLPDLRPPVSGWNELEARLRAEGLVAPAREPGRRTASGPPVWSGRGPLQAAAAVALVALGVGTGLGVAELRSAHQPMDHAAVALDSGVALAELTLAEAEELVRVTEEWYMDALLQYRDRLALEQVSPQPDPVTRWALLENLMAAGQAAVREAPTDPYLNGLLVNMNAEREATLRGLEARTAGRNWY